MSRRYHSNLKIKYTLGLLQPETAAIIPNSTKRYWKSIDINSYFGINDRDWDAGIDTLKYVCQRKTLFRLMRTIKKIEETAGVIFDSLKNTSKLLRKHSNQVVSTIDTICSFTGFRKALGIFRITQNQYRYWKSSPGCVESPLNLCRKIYYNQLTAVEVKKLKALLFNNQTLHWPLISRYYRMLRENSGYMALPTFYKYARLLGASGCVKHKDVNPKEGLRAIKPLEILHTDITELRIKDRLKVYISFVTDNYSWYILGWRVETSKVATLTKQNLEVVYFKYLANRSNSKLIVDGGSENKGVTDSFIRTTTIQKLVAQVDISFSNSMAESINRKMKYEYWLEPQKYDLEAFKQHTENAVNEYNNRPHGTLKGLTPFEALYNAPASTDYTIEIHIAAQSRRIINKSDICGLCKTENQ